jgi:hypothetical protein
MGGKKWMDGLVGVDVVWSILDVDVFSHYNKSRGLVNSYICPS